jgi:uncharacterized RDD family membrane protein YckC
MYRDELGYLTATHVIRTPELVEFEFELAGLTSRLLAWLLDCLICAFIAGGMLLAVALLGTLSEGLAGFLAFILLFSVSWGYFTVLEWRGNGRTPGKRALGLRVVQVNGARVGFAHAALRNLLRLVDHIPLLYAVGGGIALLAPSRRRLGDLIAGTIVVREHARKLPSGLASPTGAGAKPAALARLDERLRRASLPERELLLSAALRREELAMEARLVLFRDLAQYVEQRFGVQRPDHYSDEKLVLEAVSALLRAEGATPLKGPGSARSR